MSCVAYTVCKSYVYGQSYLLVEYDYLHGFLIMCEYAGDMAFVGSLHTCTGNFARVKISLISPVASVSEKSMIT